jgi:drug/metabolite transporter (DMT)-like permease
VIGVYTVAVFVFSRLLGRSERVTLIELIGGSLTVLGVALVSQPSWIFGALGARPILPFGLLLLVIAGVSVGASNVGFRSLTQGGVTPAQCNSALQGVLGAYAVATLGVCAAGTGGAPPRWSQLLLPVSALAWLALLGYVMCITMAQLSFINGIKHVRAGTAAVLGNLEIVFASLIGVLILGQPTNILSVLGNLVVFAGASLVAYGAAREKPLPPPPTGDVRMAAVRVKCEQGDE